LTLGEGRGSAVLSIRPLKWRDFYMKKIIPSSTECGKGGD